MSEAEYKAMREKENAKKNQNKQKYAKVQFKDVKDWLADLPNRQKLKGAEFKGSGHTYAKQKFATKEEYDEAKRAGK